MTRQHWRDWMEGTGYVAIVASLVFVGIETRNSTRQAELTTQALEIASYQDLMDNIALMNTGPLENPELAALLYKAYETGEILSDLERFRLNRDLYRRFRHGDMAFFHYQRGAISEARLQSVLGILRLENTLVIDFWRESQDAFVQPYRDYLNDFIAEHHDAK